MWFSRFFSKNVTSSGQPTRAPMERSFNGFLEDEVKNSQYVKRTHQQIVYAELLRKGSLEHDRELSVDEKKKLSINIEKTVYSAQADALTHEGLVIGAAKVLKAIRMSAFHRHARQEQLSKMKQAGFTKTQLIDCADERDCAWCKEGRKRLLPIESDINALIRENCTCEYCRCTLRPLRG